MGRADAASRIVEALIDRISPERPGTRHQLQQLWETMGRQSDEAFFDSLLAEARDDSVTRVHRDAMRDLVVEHLQLNLWRHHLPLIDSASAASMPAWDPVSGVLPPTDDERVPTPPLTVDEAKARLANYTVGREGVRDIPVTDRCRLVMRLAKVGFAALLPARPYQDKSKSTTPMAQAAWERRRRLVKLGQWALWPLRPVLYAIAFTAAAPIRAAACIALYIASLVVGWWAGDLADWNWRKYLIPGVPAVSLVVIAFLVAFVTRDGWKRGVLIGGAAAALFGLCFAVDNLLPEGSEEWVRWPGWIAAAGAAVAAIGTSWMSGIHRCLAVLTTIAVYVALAVLFWLITDPPGTVWQLNQPFYAGWWALASVAGTAIGLGIQVTHFDVFPKKRDT